MTSPQILFEHENEEISGSGSAKNKKQPFNAKYLNKLAEIQNDVLFYIGESDCMKKKLISCVFPMSYSGEIGKFHCGDKTRRIEKSDCQFSFWLSQCPYLYPYHIVYSFLQKNDGTFLEFGF